MMKKSLIALLTAAWTTFALAAPQDGAVFGDWKTACESKEDGPQNCHIFQHIKVKDTDKTLLHVAIGYAKESDLPIALFNLPLGIALPPGVQFKVGDGEPHKMPLSICTQQGCRAVLKLDAGLLRAMRDAASGTMTFVGPDAKAYNIPLSFAGFSEGFNSLQP
jgi:invasion protein IalB